MSDTQIQTTETLTLTVTVTVDMNAVEATPDDFDYLGIDGVIADIVEQTLAGDPRVTKVSAEF